MTVIASIRRGLGRMVRALRRSLRPPEVWLIIPGKEGLLALDKHSIACGPFETVEQVREHADDVEGIIGRRIVLEDLR